MKLYGKFYKIAAAGCLTLALFGTLAQTPAFAGPAQELGQETTKPGPAGGSHAAVDHSYYNQKITNPVVKPSADYGYDQMVQDLFALASRYPGTMTLQAVGQSADGRAIYDAIVGNPAVRERQLQNI